MDNHFAAVTTTNRIAHTVHGIVSAVDPANHAVKVLLQPENIETGWIPDAVLTQVGDLRISCPTVPGTHVVLQPIEGDGEHLVVTGVVYDTVVMPVVSPATGQGAQPGELLIATGCGAPPQGSDDPVGASNGVAGWCHVTPAGVFLGAGDARLSINDGEVVISVGGTTASLSSAGLKLEGGDIMTDLHSLNSHRHPLGNQVTGGPLG